MPCRSYTPDEEIHMQRRSIKQMQEEIDKLTRMLCTVCGALQEQHPETWKNLVTYELQDWWLTHQEQDKKRKAAEALVKHQAELKKKALAKLSDEELAVLGIKRT